jgi:hypothetical protein
LCFRIEKNEKDTFWQYGFIYAIASYFLGLTSGFYHASLTFIGQWLDNFGMVLIICWAISFNIVLISPSLSRIAFWVSYIVQLISLGLVNIFIPEIRRYAFASMILLYIGSQVYLYWKNIPSVQYRYWFGAFITLAVAFGFWILDILAFTCNPESLFQGHAVWHCLDAVTIFLLFYSYHTEQKGQVETEYTVQQDL